MITLAFLGFSLILHLAHHIAKFRKSCCKNFCVESVFYPLVTECGKQIVGKRIRILEIKHLIQSFRACARLYSTVHFCKHKRKQLKHCYDDRAKMLLHRIPVLTPRTINKFVAKKN